MQKDFESTMREMGASYGDILSLNATVDKDSTRQYQGKFSGRFCVEF